MIQHGLRDHRYRFRTIPASLVYSEAIDILGNLQFTHTMRTPDPADPTRLIATKTTTTFSMSPNMAMVLGQHFVTSRLIENAVDPTSRTIKERTIFVLTPKGKYAIQDFSQRAQVSIQAMQERLAKIDSFPIVVLERLPDHHDKLAFARPNMTLAFKVRTQFRLYDYSPEINRNPTPGVCRHSWLICQWNRCWQMMREGLKRRIWTTTSTPFSDRRRSNGSANIRRLSREKKQRWLRLNLYCMDGSAKSTTSQTEKTACAMKA